MKIRIIFQKASNKVKKIQAKMMKSKKELKRIIPQNNFQKKKSKMIK